MAKRKVESQCQFDSRPLKVGNHRELRVCRWHATYLWKSLDQGYNFAIDLASIEDLHKKLWASKMAGDPISRISRFPTCESREKWHLNVTFVVNHRKCYKRESGGFPQVWAVVSLASPCMSMVHMCTKSAPTMHLPTCYVIVQVHMNNWPACHLS
jgi:hypothetical protein